MTKEEWYKQLFSRLNNSKFRSSFHLKQKDIDYINEKGIVEGWKRGRNYYNSNGRRLSGDREQQFTAYQNARKVVSRITNKKMTQEQKLRACFRWVMPFPRADWRLLVCNVCQ